MDRADGTGVPKMVVLDMESIYWPMTGKDPYHTNEGISSLRGLQDPVILWSDRDNTTSPGGVSSDMTANVNFSAVEKSTRIFVVDSNNTHVMVRDGDTGVVAWYVDVRMIEGRASNRLLSSPALMDVDDDDRLEVLAPITDGGSHQLALFEPNITLTTSGYSLSSQSFFDDRVWLTTSGVIGPIISSTPTIFDISGDGVEDIIVGAGNGVFTYYGNNGTLFWYLEIGPMGETIGTPAIYPGTGALKRIVVNSLPTDKSSLRTTVANFQGTHLNNITVDPAPPPLVYTHVGPIPMPAVSDLDGDGNNEIIIPYPANSGLGMIKVYSYSLEELLSIDDIPGTFEGSIALADLNGDSTDEMIFQSRIFTLTSSTVMSCREVSRQQTDWDQSTVWTREGVNIGTSPVYATPLACDLNEDSLPDAVFQSNGVVYAILSDGTHFWNLTVSGQISTGNGLIGDLNTDGFLDMYIQGRMFSQKVVDLKVKDPPGTNIYLDDPEPVDGSPVTINCVVENTRGTLVEDVVVRFIDVDGPEGSPVIIGHDRIRLSDTAEASVLWTPEGSGDHTISVVVDPDSNITETDETNNQGENTFSVLSSFPDLTITAISFKRGDGANTTDSRRLVENDPSTIIVTVENIGQRSVSGGTVRINVNEDAPGGGDEETPLGTVPRGESVNVSISWTPGEVPEGEEETSFKIEAWVFPEPGVSELRSDNNNITVFTEVKSREPVGSLYIQGTVNGTQGGPESDVKVTFTLERTGESLGPVTTGSDGMYGFDMNFVDYLDGDIATIRASRDLTWGENSTRLYSEDVIREVPVQLTDLPTLSLFLSPDGETEYDVRPGEDISFQLNVENDGNIGGDVQVTKEQVGNSSLTTAGILLTPSTFTLDAEESRDVEISFSVPDGEEPGRVIEIEVTASISGNETVSRRLVYTLTVIAEEQVLVQMISGRNVTLGPQDGSATSFEMYIFNRGNIPLDYQVILSSSLDDFSTLRNGGGNLLPAEAASPYVDITLPNGSDSLSGTISISTSGLATVGSWEIAIRKTFPDLMVVSSIGSEPTDPVLEQEMELYAVVRNQGGIGVGDVVCTFYEDTTIIGSRTISNDLDPGEEVTISGVKWTPTGIGDHTVTFRIDPGEEIPETVETNNELERTFSFYPDISVKSVSIVDETLKAGKMAAFKVTVENEGNAPLSRGFIVRLNLDTKSGAQLVSKNFDDRLDPSRDPEQTVTLEFQLPSGSGNRSVHVTVLAVGDDMEQDSSDNSYSTEVDIKGSDDDKGIMDYLPYILIVIVVLLIAAGGYYVWRFGLPSSPPPEEEVVGSGDEDVLVESGEIPEDDSSEVPEMEMTTPPEEEPVVEMEVEQAEEPDEEDTVMVAEVVEAVIEEETAEVELIPEV
jgi:hypothetical protein